jgi:NAD(P)-dependent dehydrogenase (short-subunit alcohol dehydrogenase family)
MVEPERTMTGKYCLVTGATSGIGRVTARALAERGASVMVVGRSRERCEATVETIRQGVTGSEVEFFQADLSSQAEIRRLSREVRDRVPRLDVLVNNAGTLSMKRQESVDGIEMTFALNHLAYFLLTNLLLDRLKASAPARIISVSSDAHHWARRIDFAGLPRVERYRGFQAYSQSKLANLLFTYELARRLEGTGVTANALHPGFVATNIFAGNGLAGWMMRAGARFLAISPEEGARTTVLLATAPELEGVSGRFFVRGRPVSSSRASRDQDAARRLWDVSEALTGCTATHPA